MLPLAIVLLSLAACNNNNDIVDKPAASQQSVSFHPLINIANNSARKFKNTQWDLWCQTYSTFYDSLLAVESNSDTVLFKQPVLDSIIQYKQFYTDSTLPLLRDAYYNRGYDLDEDAQYYLARDNFEAVLQLGASIGFNNFQQEFVTLNRLANILNMLGDIRQSVLIRQRQIERCKQDGSANQLATAYLNLAILYSDTGQQDTAINILQQALTLTDASKWSRAKLYSTLSSIQVPIDTTAARKNSRLAMSLLKTFTEEGDTLDFIAGTYGTLAQLSNANEAEDLYKLTIQKKIAYEGTAKQREVGKAYLSLAAFYKTVGLASKEIAAIQKTLYTVADIDTADLFSLPARNNLYPENTIMEALDAKSNWMMRNATAGKQPYLEHAVQCFDLAFEVERKLMQHFSYSDSKLLMLQESRIRSEKAIECCRQLYHQTKNIDWIKKAWQFAEKSKAIVLLHSIRENLAGSALEQDSQYRRVEQLQQLLTVTETNLYELTNKNERGDSAAIKALQQKQQAQDQQLLDARIKLRQDNYAYRYLLEKEDSLDLQLAEKNLLDRHTAFVEYFMGDSAAYAFYLHAPGQPQLFPLPATTDTAISSFLYYFTDKRTILNDPLGYQQAAYNLYQHLLHPLTINKQINSLIIIPDARLSALPFDALLTQSSAGSNLNTLPYAIHQYQFSFGYSIITLLNQSVNNTPDPGVLAFAPVEFNNRPQLQALPYTAEEMEMLREKFSGGTVLTHQGATISNFREQSHNAAIIHIASHASAETGARPFVQFADSALYLDELYGMHLHADLVVLSTCESGAGKIEKGEGTMSLARGFYYAGAANIINSLWKVNDRSTAALFKEFYKNTGDGSYARALQSAKLAYLQKEGAAEKSSPFYWAGFVIIGRSNAAATAGSGAIVGLVTILLILILLLLIYSWSAWPLC